MHILDSTNIKGIKIWQELALVEGAVALIDKDKEWTSFDAVNKLRGVFKIKKTGHAGTLDPLATGLLILCFGKATKTIESFQGLPKTYTGKFKLGATTKTYDSEAEEENNLSIENINFELIVETSAQFVGKIMQKPPMYSAKSVNGQRLYQLARKNIEIEIKPVEVEVHSFSITNFEAPFVSFEIQCSKGTYIRSIAHDIGVALECGAYLSELRRTAIGGYSVDNALTVNQIVEAMK